MLCGIYLGVKTSTSKGQLKVVYYEIDDLALFCNSTLYTKNYKASVYLCRHKPKNLEVYVTKGASSHARCTLGITRLFPRKRAGSWA